MLKYTDKISAITHVLVCRRSFNYGQKKLQVVYIDLPLFPVFICDLYRLCASHPHRSTTGHTVHLLFLKVLGLVGYTSVAIGDILKREIYPVEVCFSWDIV